MLINELRKWLSCGGDQIAFFENFSPPKAFYYDLPKLRNFQESPTPPLHLLSTTPSFYGTSW